MIAIDMQFAAKIRLEPKIKQGEYSTQSAATSHAPARLDHPAPHHGVWATEQLSLGRNQCANI
jgi:hypothetical protein